MRAERFWRQAREVAARALEQGALVPLETRQLQVSGLEPFQLRQLVSAVPRHLRDAGPRPNPFLPWDRPLQVEHLGSGHVLLLNKYPVQGEHMLVITDQWQPQDGWITPADWDAVMTVSADTGGLWFFNSHATAGASQPHRHLQLLPRRLGQCSCPLAPLLQAQLHGQAPSWNWSYRLRRRNPERGQCDLQELYLELAQLLGLGDPDGDPRPRHPYNLLFDDDWFLMVRRRREHGAGFSVNGLGFAGYLLCTPSSDLEWLRQHGPWTLLQSVAEPA
ncbi:MAG: ATP adenylyltransferase [Synechococcaceae cyanobacterium]|nr:ATP adenylyltransferase [Synechococcaceae cyanobacterium]